MRLLFQLQRTAGRMRTGVCSLQLGDAGLHLAKVDSLTRPAFVTQARIFFYHRLPTTHRILMYGYRFLWVKLLITGAGSRIFECDDSGTAIPHRELGIRC